MPGVLLREDWQKAVTGRLQQHAQDTLQAMQQANQPPLQNVQAPSLPNLQIDPNEIIGRLQQHAQDAFQAAQQANQPPLAGVQVDPNDIIQRLQQHAQDALQSVGQNVQPIAEGLQQINQPPLAGAQPTPAPSVTAGVTPSGQQPPTPSAAPIAGAPTAAGGSLVEFARQQAQAAGIDPDLFVRQIQQESGFRTDARSTAGAVGIAQFMPETARGLGIDPSDPIAALKGAAQLMGNYLTKYGGDYAKALAAYNAGPGNVEQYGGVPPFEETQRYVKTILGNAGQAIEGGRRAVAGAVLPALSQFGDRQLNSLEAYAACGPASAVRFAQMFGRNPTLREAVDLAKNVGWTEGQGMAGLQSESKLFSEMGVPHRVLGADWQAFAREAQSGNPVTLSTPGHYFTADAYDPASGAFHVGSSGTDLRGGKEWMTPADIEARMGALQGGLVADNPNVPGSSPLSGGRSSAPTSPVEAARDVAGRALGSGLQVIDSAVRQIADTSNRPLSPGAPVREAIANAPVLGGALGMLRGPELVGDQELLERSSPQALEVGRQYAQLGGVKNPTDADVANVLRSMQLGEAYAGTHTPGSTRMYHGTGSAFDRPDPGRFDPNGLFGPGYYLTSEPRVAGGQVRAETEPLTAVQQSLIDRGLLSPENARNRAGTVLESGYAQNFEGTDYSIQQDIQRLRKSLEVPGLSDRRRYAAEQGILELEGKLGRATAGPNVRAVDVPQNLRLFDVDAPAGDAAQTLRDVLGRVYGPKSGKLDLFDNFLADTPDPTGDNVYRALQRSLTGTGQSPNAANAEVNHVLHVAGYDGIQYAGGSRVPMMDAGGAPIEHQATVIFPESLDKITNAISGQQGGAANAGYAAALGGAGALGLAALSQRDGFTAPDLSEVPGRISDALGQLGEGIPGLSEADRAARRQALEDSPLGQLYGSEGRKQNLPNITEPGHPLNVLGDLQNKYQDASDKLGLRITERMTPEDRAAYENAQLGVGGMVGSVGIEQKVLQSLRESGLQASSRIPPPPPPGSPLRTQWLQGTGPWAPTPPRGPIATWLVDATKQSILSNPATHIANVIGNTIELARQPVSLTLGGRPGDALAGLAAITQGIPEAARNAASALSGQQLPTLATAGGRIGAPTLRGALSTGIFRGLSASDAFTRTLGEYQGMAAEANRLLRQAGMAADDPGAADYLASHAVDLYREGTRAGAQSVFGRVASTGQGSGVLDNIFRSYSRTKEGFLNSPRLRDQAVGALMDFGIPFSGVPVQMLQIALNRLPVTAQATGAVRAIRALRAGNMGEAQRAVGDTVLESAIQVMIAKQVADGNVKGPDDPDHPNSVRIGGNWVSMNEWGAYALPMQIMASFADGYEKGGQEVPAGAGWAEAMGPRGAAALNASLKPFQKGIPGENLIRLVSNIGQGGATAGALGVAQDAVNRITVPGAARFVENLTDPVARDINRKGVSSLWQGPVSNWPGLAQLLPAKIDPTTGEVLQKARTGLGTLVGGQQDVSSAITEEANRLKQAGYKDISPPKTYPQSVTVAGAQIQLSPDEQRKVTEITGKVLGSFASQLESPNYQNSTEDRKAKMMQAYLNKAEQARVAAAREVLGVDELRRRAIAGQRTAGRLNAQAPAPEIPFLSSSSLSAQEQAALAGVGG